MAPNTAKTPFSTSATSHNASAPAATIAVHFNGADRQLRVPDRKPVRPVVVERHRGLDLALADIAVEFFRRVDALEAGAMVEDLHEILVHRRPKCVGVGAQRRVRVARRVDIGGKQQVGNAQPVHRLRGQRIDFAQHADQGVARQPPIVGRTADDHEPCQVVQGILARMATATRPAARRRSAVRWRATPASAPVGADASASGRESCRRSGRRGSAPAR